MNAIKSLIIAVLLSVFPAIALAQDQSSAEHHRRFNPNHPGYDGNVNTPPPPQEVWENKYGAIAGDFAAGRGGFAEDQRSARAARRVALRQCGTRNCKILAESRNGCLATAFGGGVTGVGALGDESGAIQRAVRNCELGGGNNCEPRYVHCNLPVRVRIR